jgi:CubicO group peptidase (beta-lactamase class C family)
MKPSVIQFASTAVLVVAIGSSSAAQSTAAPNTQRMDELMRFYADDPQEAFMGVVLVARGQELLFAKGYGMANLEWSVPNTPHTKFSIGSNSKQFTAVAILLLEERGKLRVTDSIKSYWPETPVAWAGITFHHLLTHTSGLIGTAPLDRGAASLPARPQATVERFRNLPLLFEPGTRFAYSNCGYQLLAFLIERIAGQRYEDFVQANIFAPLGMTDSGSDTYPSIIPSRASGYVRRGGTSTSSTGPALMNAPLLDKSNGMGAGSLYSTVGDLHRWTLALFGGKVLKPGSLTKLTTPTAFDTAYAYGLGIGRHDGRHRFSHGGTVPGFASILNYYPESQVTVAVMRNSTAPPAPGERRATLVIADGLGTLAHGGTVALPSKR